jgi:hypothetical protein
MTYSYRRVKFSVERLHLGISREHRCAAALVREPFIRGSSASASASASASVSASSGFRLVLQGSPESAAGETGLRTEEAAQFPTLEETLKMSLERVERLKTHFPGGAQRNWVYSVSVDPVEFADAGAGTGFANLASLQEMAEFIRGERGSQEEQLAAAGARDKFLEQFRVRPVRIMVLVDLYRDGVQDIPAYLCAAGFSFWMVTGDGRANAEAIADALGMHSVHVQPGSVTSVSSFAENLRQTLKGQDRVTLFLDKKQQVALCQIAASTAIDQVAKDELRDLLCRADSKKGHPSVQVVCFGSEADTKGTLVSFGKDFLRVATVFTGDGKNDIHALELADVGMAFPSLDQPSSSSSLSTSAQQVFHDPEVAASAAMRVMGDFWSELAKGNLNSWASMLWAQVASVVLLLVIKQSGTAGLNCAAAASTDFLDNSDPYDPHLYLIANVIGFAVVVAAGGFVIRPHASTDVHQGVSRLRVLPVIMTSVLSYAFGFASFYAAPLFQIAARNTIWLLAQGAPSRIGRSRQMLLQEWKPQPNVTAWQEMDELSLASRTSSALVMLLAGMSVTAFWLAVRR